MGVARGADHCPQRPGLDDAFGVHHGDPVGDLRRDADGMGDEDHARPELSLQPAHQ
jgi:hypothetical protein